MELFDVAVCHEQPGAFQEQKYFSSVFKERSSL
jgi:hypothetical protein